jgi:hypothetical protein
VTSARELLEQADALMKRGGAEPDDDDVPVLEDVVELPAAQTALAVSAHGEARVSDARPRGGGASEGRARGPDAGDGDAQGGSGEASFSRAEIPSPQPLHALLPGLHEPGTERDEPRARGDGEELRATEMRDDEGTRVHASGRRDAAATEDAPAREEAATRGVERARDDERPRDANAADDARWELVRQRVFASVMQRLDVLAAPTLDREVLGELRRIVDEAGEQMLARIDAELGALVRRRVAEAIEQELGAERLRGEGR